MMHLVSIDGVSKASRYHEERSCVIVNDYANTRDARDY
jgi:hypothetical protein